MHLIHDRAKSGCWLEGQLAAVLVTVILHRQHSIHSTAAGSSCMLPWHQPMTTVGDLSANAQGRASKGAI